MGLWLFGFLIGPAVVFLLMQQRVSQQAKTLKHARIRLEQMDREHKQQIRNATLKLQEDYGQRLAEQKANYERQLTEQKARLQAEFTQQTAALEQKYAANMRLQEHPLESPHQIAARESEDTPSSVSTVLVTSEATQTAVASPASPSSTDPISSQPDSHGSSLPPLSDPVHQPLISGLAAAQPLTRLSAPPQGETSLSALTAASQQVNPADRKQVATVLGQIVVGNKRAPAQRSIPILGKLMQDPDPAVRQAAAEALGKMSSPKVIPLLKRALRDTDSDVVKTSSIALSKFKGASSSKTGQSKTRKKLPKNR
ncbi:MAG: HEAT repeat domain-containing protein [Leptolyngbyaceae cyanobacterium MO_188.B28]|nr:HEAT repeat domain-containing protein [Leptolyngbyaceae cyanobacterium MO_188.B28]